MCDQQNNIRYIWQLLSQFVSWEFCRYMCEVEENDKSEADVLTYLRNMIVQRTEKSVSNITKHEIVAKFIMETRSIENVSRMSCIVALSESVTRICPELQHAVNKLVLHLETFLNVLESTDESRKELIQVRITDTINDFSKEAKRLLPDPDLLKVVETWNHHNGHTPQKPVRKVIYNAMLFEKVLECLHYESITPAEAKLIAVALHEDKAFERILFNAEAEMNETEADSEQFSFSVQSSQPNEHIFSQEFGKNVENQISYKSTNAECSTSHANAFQTSTEFPEAPDEIFGEPPHLSPVQAPVVPSHVQFSSEHHLIHSNISQLHRNEELQNNGTDNHMQFAQSSGNESPTSELNSAALHDRIQKKFKIINYRRTQNQSDSDTSDCDKNPQFKFLTPTFFKEGIEKTAPPKSQVFWLSDNESNDSSIITTVTSSQHNDPNWTTRTKTQVPGTKIKMIRKTRLQTQVLQPSNNDLGEISDSDSSDSSDRIPHTKDPTHFTRKKMAFLQPQAMKIRKKVVRQLESDSSESIHNSLIENEGNLLHRLQQLPATSVIRNDAESERPAKKLRVGKTVKLYSPSRSFQDFALQIRKPVPVATNGVPVHRGTNTTPSKRKKSVKKTAKGKKCEDCKKAFKTAVSLRRHVFLKHTQALDDSDCDP